MTEAPDMTALRTAPAPAVPATIPAAILPSPLRADALATIWPEKLRCRRFEELGLFAGHDLSGVEWRGPQGAHRFLLPAKTAPKDPMGLPPSPLSQHAKLPIPPSLSPVGLIELLPIFHHGVRSKPRLARLQLVALCQEPAGADVGFGCLDGRCETTVWRALTTSQPIGGTYLGLDGWEWLGSRRSRHELMTLLNTPRENLLPALQNSLIWLGRDLLAELYSVLEITCAEDTCAEPARAAMASAAQLLKEKVWQLHSVKPPQPDPKRRIGSHRGWFQSSLWREQSKLGAALRVLAHHDQDGLCAGT